jgi:hypothetical protein
MLVGSVQQAGELDLVIRCMEEDFKQDGPLEQPPWFGFNYQKMLSDLWVGSAYEILRLLKARKLAAGEGFLALERDLTLIRITVDKHEIASDRKLREPLQMRTAPHHGGEARDYMYDPEDPRKAHIMGAGLSPRGSVMWHAIDGASQAQKWIERRDLTDRLMSLFQRPVTPPQS